MLYPTTDRHFGNLCSSLHCNRKLHLALHILSKSILLPPVTWSRTAIYDGKFACVLYYFWLVFSSVLVVTGWLIYYPECICNGFAELSRSVWKSPANVYKLSNCSESFADRQFYEDWVSAPLFLVGLHSYFFQWNSTSWDEFARKWNKPVHTFLLRHVYSATRKSYRISKSGAMFVTFLLSASAHELVMVIVTKKIRLVSLRGCIYILSDKHSRMYLFILQVCLFIPLRSDLLKNLFCSAHSNSLDHAWTPARY